MRDPGRARAPLLTLLCVLVAAAADPRPVAEPLDPPEGAVVGSRPIFHVTYPDVEGSDPRTPRLRIRIESREVGGATILHDQRRRRGGWTPGEPGTMLFRPRHPLADGSYEWSVELWNGSAWDAGGRPWRFRVDTVPPAPVRNVRALGDPERRVVRLTWDPVTSDVRGGAEFVARYHIYRYSRPGDQRFVEAYEVARTEDTRVELSYDAAGAEEGPWFLRVTAEDLAGNAADRPE